MCLLLSEPTSSSDNGYNFVRGQEVKEYLPNVVTKLAKLFLSVTKFLNEISWNLNKL